MRQEPNIGTGGPLPVVATLLEEWAAIIALTAKRRSHIAVRLLHIGGLIGTAAHCFALGFWVRRRAAPIRLHNQIRRDLGGEGSPFDLDFSEFVNQRIEELRKAA